MNTTMPLNQRRDAARATAINIIRVKQFQALNGVLVLLILLCCLTSWGGGNTCLPGWSGQLLAPTTGLLGWSVESDDQSFGTLSTAVDSSGTNIQLNWNIGAVVLDQGTPKNRYVQAYYEFSPPIDLSAADIFGVTLRGDSDTPANFVTIMCADNNGLFFGYDFPGENHGINQVTRWLPELPIPKKAFRYFWGGSGSNPALDWSNIQKLFVVVKPKDSSHGGGSGRLSIGRLQYDQAASWPRQKAFATIPNRAKIQHASSKAIQYLLTAQQPNGLLTSWREEYSPTAVLYDQALALIALTREGVWVLPHAGSWGRSVALTCEGVWANGAPANACAVASRKLAQFLVTSQKSDGHWARRWNPLTGAELPSSAPLWVGDQAWCVMALTEYALRSGNVSARTAAAKGAQWLAGFIEPSGAIQDCISTEGTVDVWWAMISTLRFSDAEKIKSYLLNNVWDADLHYWWVDAKSDWAPSVAMDCATWLSAFARHPLVAHPERGLAALSFVRRTLLTTSDDGKLCGFDGLGPVSIWNEGTAQYVAAGGEDASVFLETLLVQQNSDGSMPGSPDEWSTDAFGWLSKMSGVAPTAWLYFATKGLPFPQCQSQLRW
jgi:hypothetical protein